MAGEAFGLKPETKATLAELGQSLGPNATVRKYKVPGPGEKHDVVVVDRVRKDELPEYCVHGYATCVACQEMCWLGSETERAVVAGEMFPLCLDCATRLLPRDPEAQRVGSLHLDDHRRADGPHT